MVQEIKNLGEFHALINQDKLVAIDFWAIWCGPCRTISPVFEKLADQFPGAIFAKVDVDAATDISEEVGIRAMPTFVFFKNGVKLGELVGANPNALLNEIQKHY